MDVRLLHVMLVRARLYLKIVVSLFICFLFLVNFLCKSASSLLSSARNYMYRKRTWYDVSVG